MPSFPASSSLPARPVTTTDLLKFVGIVFVLVDHHGYFFDPTNMWWRLFGRVAAPIFFFLVGFARSREVPWTWLAFGAALTAITTWKAGSVWALSVNILINFALLRAVVLPLVERHVMPRPLAVAALVAVCLPLIPPTDMPLEYGTEGWLWAFFGLAHRLALAEAVRPSGLGHRLALAAAARRPPGGTSLHGLVLALRSQRAALTRNGTGAGAATAYIVREIYDYGFTTPQIVILFLLVGTLTLTLASFRRVPLPVQPPEPLAVPMRFCGRHSLEIYAITLFVSYVVAYAIAP